MLTVEYKNNNYTFVDANYRRRIFSDDKNYYLFVELETENNKLELHFINWDIQVREIGNGVDMSYWLMAEETADHRIDLYSMFQMVKRLVLETLDNEELI